MPSLLHHPTPVAARAFNVIRPWQTSLAFWGAGAGVGVVFFLSTTPIVRGVLSQIPVVGSYYEDKTPPSDKPF